MAFSITVGVIVTLKAIPVRLPVSNLPFQLYPFKTSVSSITETPLSYIPNSFLNRQNIVTIFPKSGKIHHCGSHFCIYIFSGRSLNAGWLFIALKRSSTICWFLLGMASIMLNASCASVTRINLQYAFPLPAKPDRVYQPRQARRLSVTRLSMLQKHPIDVFS